MSEWICVDDVIVEIGGGYIDIDAESFMSAPSIDIVCCEECKHTDGNSPIADGRYWCKYHNSFMYYCSDGERASE